MTEATLPGWVAPGEPKPAPGPLLLVQSFVNTLDLDAGTDLLSDGPAASGWLRETGLIGPEVRPGPDDLGAARDVRDGIRALLARGRSEPGPGELRPLQELAAGARLRLAIDPAGRIELDPGRSGQLADGLLALLLAIRDAQLDGTWRQLKVCANQDCRWVFYDRSHSGSGTWCDMASCGNLIKNRNLRARRGRAHSGDQA